MPVMTVSRQMGSGGSEIAQVAETLGFRFIDREIIHHAAREAGVPKVALQEIEFEGHRGFIERILDGLKTMPAIPDTPQASVREAQAQIPLPFGGILTPALPPVAATLDDYVRMVNLVIEDLAQSDDVVIVGRGGQAILRDHPNVFHLQVIASLETRVARLVAQEDWDQTQAKGHLSASDRAREDYMRRFHRIDWLDPVHYDLVINADRFTIQAASQVALAASQLALAASQQRRKQGPELPADERRD
ncbi:MAG: AAA family ATPase [Anaerolineae bacterium]